MEELVFDNEELEAEELETEEEDFEELDAEEEEIDENAEELETEEDETDDGLAAGDRLVPVVPVPGCAVSFYADNKRHHAVCLAVIGDDLLLEHKGASRCFLFTGKVIEIVPRLRFGVASATIIVGMLKTCRYRSVPKKWLQQMVKTGQTWKGIERGGGVVPPPADLLKDNGQLELF